MIELDNYIFENSETVKIHSKEIRKGDVFVALSGKIKHGNEFITEAMNNGAKFIITDKKPKNIKTKNIILVNNTMDFLYELANKKRNLYKGIVIGITGSVGKTSVKENLKYFLSNLYEVSASIKSYNNYLGVILSVINLNLKAKYSIFEIGTSNFNEIASLTSIVKPSQVIITNILPTHLENLINTKNVGIEKSDIFNKKYNPNIELAILPNNNIDEKNVLKRAKYNQVANIISIGTDFDSDLKIKKITDVDKNNIKIDLIYKKQKLYIEINQNQKYRVTNILACLLVFIYNEIKLDSFFLLSKEIPLVEGRGLLNNIIINNKNIKFIDESYNASPYSMKTCLDYFRNLTIKDNKKKFLILGDMKELGKNTISFHIDLINYILEKKIENVIICGELMKIALDKSNNKKILFMHDLNSIVEYIEKKLNNGDYLLIKGSNSSLTSKIAQKLLIGDKVDV